MFAASPGVKKACPGVMNLCISTIDGVAFIASDI